MKRDDENETNEEGSNGVVDHSKPLLKEKAPEDKNNIVYLLMVLFGIACLLPWNAVLTSLDFFINKVRLLDSFSFSLCRCQVTSLIRSSGSL